MRAAVTQLLESERFRTMSDHAERLHGEESGSDHDKKRCGSDGAGTWPPDLGSLREPGRTKIDHGCENDTLLRCPPEADCKAQDIRPAVAKTGRQDFATLDAQAPTADASPNAAIGYRYDIDGLRAIAVLAVVLCHAEIAGFSGGYVGVDIFFVISGFLITSILLRQIETGAFSILQFYRRRIRRILPALIVVLGMTLIACAVLLTPSDFARVGYTAMAAALMVPNFAFWRASGYFAEDAHEIPLLHTSSLGVEEQFYLFFPILLLLLVHFRWTLRKVAIIGLFLASLAI